ncbi:MAG: hypothetical protein KAR37_02900, partial [Alphaproteobacteria bacterium]|nr:hypothetical protein [Alphaproteobacteria bacterium]
MGLAARLGEGGTARAMVFSLRGNVYLGKTVSPGFSNGPIPRLVDIDSFDRFPLPAGKARFAPWCAYRKRSAMPRAVKGKRPSAVPDQRRNDSAKHDTGFAKGVHSRREFNGTAYLDRAAPRLAPPTFLALAYFAGVFIEPAPGSNCPGRIFWPGWSALASR